MSDRPCRLGYSMEGGPNFGWVNAERLRHLRHVARRYDSALPPHGDRSPLKRQASGSTCRPTKPVYDLVDVHGAQGVSTGVVMSIPVTLVIQEAWRDPRPLGADCREMPRKIAASDMDVMAGRRLRAAREALNVRQDTLAAKLGVGRTALANWEGGRLPDVRAMVRLFQLTGITLEWIYAGVLRGVPHEMAQALEERAGGLGVVLGAPTAEWPMRVERERTTRSAGGVPIRRPKGTSLHDTIHPFKSHAA